MKIEKGQPGYLKARKMKYLIFSIVEFAIVAALVILGYVQTGSKMNLLTVVAVVGCLPAAKMLVEFIAMAPHKSIAPEKYQEIEEKAPLLTKMYDTLLTVNEKMMPVEVFVISGHVICGYTSSERTDEVKTARFIKNMLEKHHFEKITVKVFHDYTAFLSRAEGMNNIATVEQADTRKKERRIRRLILSISM